MTSTTPRARLAIIGCTFVALAACASSSATTAVNSTTAIDSTSSSTSRLATTVPLDIATTQVPGTAVQTSQVSTTSAVTTTTVHASSGPRPGATTLHLKAGPFDIQPGQNNIDTTFTGVQQPSGPGWIVGFRPNLHFDDPAKQNRLGTIPAVDDVHLHHGVWLSFPHKDATRPSLPAERFFAAGEEKTTLTLPEPYGYRFAAGDHWVLNYMLHNLRDDTKKVWITYDVDFIPDTAPQAASVSSARPLWMDVQNGSVYPVFDVLMGAGTHGTYTYPDQASNPYGSGPHLNAWTVDRAGVLIATAGHLHPGGLHTDLWVTRSGKKSRLFSSVANYYEPAGAVSWDVSMTATRPTWRAAVRQGDVLSISATYDSARASWYESMGIMIVWMGAPSAAAPDPFATKVDGPGVLTHGHLAENDNHGGANFLGYVDLTNEAAVPSTPAPPSIDIQNWVYAVGDMGGATAVPTVQAGQPITFHNSDANIGKGQWHTITSCRAPCNKSTGIAYPLADGPVIFDSGELGLGGAPTANRDAWTWTVPAGTPAGTYTYFCRIHPLMRGAFRVTTP